MPHCVLTRYHMLCPLETPLLYVSLLCVLNIPRSLKHPHYTPSIFLIYSYSWCVWNILIYIVLFMHIISLFDGKMMHISPYYPSHRNLTFLLTIPMTQFWNEAEGIYLREHVERLEAGPVSPGTQSRKAKNTMALPIHSFRRLVFLEENC